MAFGARKAGVNGNAADALGRAMPMPTAAAATAPPTSMLRSEQQDAYKRLNLSDGVAPSATGQNLGELFRYAITNPVSISRQQSAMLPIVNADVKGEKFTIYNPLVDAKHPLNGLRLTNTSGLHLMQGPITVFDDGEYAGDARIEDVVPGATRLISYALDLDTEIAQDSKVQPLDLVSVKIAKGTVFTNHKQRRTVNYTVRNSSDKLRKVLIEYPRDTSWTLIAPKEPAEKTCGVSLSGRGQAARAGQASRRGRTGHCGSRPCSPTWIPVPWPIIRRRAPFRRRSKRPWPSGASGNRPWTSSKSNSKRSPPNG